MGPGCVGGAFARGVLKFFSPEGSNHSSCVLQLQLLLHLQLFAPQLRLLRTVQAHPQLVLLQVMQLV